MIVDEWSLSVVDDQICDTTKAFRGSVAAIEEQLFTSNKSIDFNMGKPPATEEPHRSKQTINQPIIYHHRYNDIRSKQELIG